MNDITEPDFDKWAYRLTELDGGAFDLKQDVGLALKQAYEQGKVLGYREGYDHGLNVGWAEIQDADQDWLKDLEYMDVDAISPLENKWAKLWEDDEENKED